MTHHSLSASTDLDSIVIYPGNGETCIPVQRDSDLWDALESRTDVVQVVSVPLAFIEDFANGMAWALLNLATVYDDEGNTIESAGEAASFGSPRTDWERDTFEGDDGDTIYARAEDFVRAHYPDLAACANTMPIALPMCSPAYYLGHLFVLDSNGHGMGFADCGWGVHGNALHEAAQVYGTITAAYHRDSSSAHLTES